VLRLLVVLDQRVLALRIDPHEAVKISVVLNPVWANFAELLDDFDSILGGNLSHHYAGYNQ
jgi:hypothetical protein